MFGDNGAKQADQSQAAYQTRSAETGSDPKPPTKIRRAPTAIGVSLTQLIDAKVISTPLKLFKKYKGTELSATVLADGSVELDGQKFDSCSSAATFARGTIVGGTPPTIGWIFWKYRDTQGKVHQLDHAR